MSREHAGPPFAAQSRYRSWGGFPRADGQRIWPVTWQSELPPLDRLGASVLAFGMGRSYGDVCLNDGGILLDTVGLNRFIAFDRHHGALTCEAGVTLGQMLDLTLPSGWMPPVVPGTRHVTVGGAIANDIHGKNHHRAGSFGCHVRALELLRSSGERVRCSPREHADLFAATIGGLGLTGLILRAELALNRVDGVALDVEWIRFPTLAEFFALCDESDGAFEYTVAWVDALARGSRLGRGVFFRANPAPARQATPKPAAGPRFLVPADAPEFLLNRLTVGLFNGLYYRARRARVLKRGLDPDSFFFPLDRLADWNRLYGRRGLIQHQSVVPPAAAPDAVRDLLECAARSGQASFLAVLKRFGPARSPGLLSFPRPGVTLTLDLPMHGEATLALCGQLDRVVEAAGGAVYPAKDARMSPESFARFFPLLDRFEPHRDRHFSSSFWRRVRPERR